MSKTDPLLQIRRLHHFTARRNLPLIREHRGLYPASELARLGIRVPAPGGNEWSRKADAISGMDRYVHLCFKTEHPMEYYKKDTIFLEIDPDVLKIPGVMYTSDVSNKSGVVPITIEAAKDEIDFDVLYTWTDWKDPAIKQRLKAAKKCEVLVPELIPLDLIRDFSNG